MKIAYLLVLKESRYMSVLDKVLTQVDMWKTLGVDVKLFLISNIEITNPSIIIINEGSMLRNTSRLLQEVKSFDPDYLYHRLWLLSPWLFPFLSKYKLIAEINTDVYKEIELEKTSSFKAFVSYLYNRLTEKYYYKRLYSAISVTKELENYRGISHTYTVPNSISVKSFPYRKIVTNNDTINIFFIGTPGLSWHGIDILMDIARFIGNKATFHVVGFSKEDVENIPVNVSFYGVMHINDYASIAKNCSVGVGTLALYRKEMREACPLKVREYLAAGLPVVLPYQDTAFIDTSPAWVLKLGEINESSMEKVCQEILEFSIKNNDYVIPQDEVNKYIDSETLEKKRIEYIFNSSN